MSKNKTALNMTPIEFAEQFGFSNEEVNGLIAVSKIVGKKVFLITLNRGKKIKTLKVTRFVIELDYQSGKDKYILFTNYNRYKTLKVEDFNESWFIDKEDAQKALDKLRDVKE